MHEHGLAKEFMPQLETIAANNGFARVTYLEMIVGMLHGESEEALAHGFEHAFKGTSFEGADTDISVVEPGSQFKAPGRSDIQTANGWELLIVRIQGDKKPQEMTNQ